VLTSRFPFADLERFDGTSARMLEVPPFNPAEGAALLAGAGAGWLDAAERRDLSRGVDGHALALDAMARVAATQMATADLDALRAELAAAATTDERVAKVPAFYAGRLSAADRALVGIVSLFGRPVAAETVLALGAHEKLGSPMAGWAEAEMAAAVASRLGGLVSRHPDGALSAHPLVRDSFRPLVLSPNAVDLAAERVLADLPDGRVRSREEALRVVELVELLLDAGQWRSAADLHQRRTENGRVFLWLPAFVSGTERAEACRRQLGHRSLSLYLCSAGLFATTSGGVADAHRFLAASNHVSRPAESSMWSTWVTSGRASLSPMAWCVSSTSKAHWRVASSSRSGIAPCSHTCPWTPSPVPSPGRTAST